MDSCRCRDQVNWTPELWWLLNWWTWQFPPPDLNGLNDVGNCAGLYALERVQVEPVSMNEPTFGTPPTLSTVVDGEEQAASPPMQIDAVHRTINMGNGLIDLFA